MSSIDKIESTERTIRPQAIYAVFVLFVANLVGYLDRQIMTLFVNPIRESLGLSDGAIGLLQGFAFVATYIVAGLLMGRLVDRTHRRNLLVLCVAVWTLSAATGGLAQEGWQLFLARMGVGIGEAALIPAAVSIISDYYEESARGRAYGLFTTGVYAGAGLSLLLVAFALPFVSQLSLRLTEFGVNFEPWRLVMISMLVPGVICSALLLTMKEPARSPIEAMISITGTGDAFSSWLANLRVFLPHHLSMSMVSLGMYAATGWLPTVFIRELHFTSSQTGITLGLIVMVFGIVGSSSAGFVADAFSKYYGVRGRMYAASGCAAIGGAGFLILLWASSVTAAVMCAGALIVAGLSMAIVIGITAMADMCNSQNRGFVSAIYFVFTGSIGAAAGPAIVGFASDALSGIGVTLGHILGIVGSAASLAGVLLAVYTAFVLKGSAPAGAQPDA